MGKWKQKSSAYFGACNTFTSPEIVRTFSFGCNAFMGLNAMLNSVVPLKDFRINLLKILLTSVISGMLYNDPSGKCLAFM